jgi:hypothetical protein
VPTVAWQLYVIKSSEMNLDNVGARLKQWLLRLVRALHKRRDYQKGPRVEGKKKGFLWGSARFRIASGLTPNDRLCGLVVRILGYRFGGPGSIPGTARRKKVVGLERGPLSLVSKTEELLDRKVEAPV